MEADCCFQRKLISKFFFFFLIALINWLFLKSWKVRRSLCLQRFVRIVKVILQCLDSLSADTLVPYTSLSSDLVLHIHIQEIKFLFEWVP